jgi:hypothetical protein
MDRLALPAREYAGLDEPSLEDLQGAAAFITWNARDAELVSASGLPTILLGQLESPAQFQKVRLVRSTTRFLADLRLEDVFSALDASWVIPSAGSASSLAMPCAHIGHGGKKIPGAIGVDSFCVGAGDWRGDGRDLWFCQSQSFASARLEIRPGEETHLRLRIQEATRILRCGGLLELRLPTGQDLDPVLSKRLGLQRVDSTAGSLRFCKTQARSYFVEREARVQPAVSVLIISEVHDSRDLEAARLRASIESAHRSLASIPHEILVLQRQLLESELQASLRSCVAEIPQACLFEEQAPLDFAARHEYLRRRASGEYLLLLPAGDILQLDCPTGLLNDARSNHCAALQPKVCDPRDNPLDPAQSAGHGLLIAACAWPIGRLQGSNYRGHTLWRRFLIELEAEGKLIAEDHRAQVITAGLAGRGLRGHALATNSWDCALLQAGRPLAAEAKPRRILVSLLRSMGDCILGSTVLDALHRKHPDAEITLLTEERYTWLFAAHPALTEILAAPRAEGSGNEVFWAEDLQLSVLQEEREYDRLILLSDNLDHCPYFDCGLPFQEFYAILAGMPEAASLPLRLRLPTGSSQAAQVRLQEAGVHGEYAVLHTRAGWPERSPPAELFASASKPAA